jgi:signal transduction histidine kinase/ligand-binding sensor domain-containing protein/CheY-like chemotaxis protein/AraC-like DNA-binding protein
MAFALVSTITDSDCYMNLKKLQSLCLFIITYAITTAQQGNINFTALTTKEGLSSNTVNTVLKDRFGLIWFGTEDGLDKFDGTAFSVYRHTPGDSSSLQANEILSLHEDNKGNLWVGTSGGSLSLYDRKKDRFQNFFSDGSGVAIANNVIRGICSDHNGKIWIAHFSGVDILDPITRRVTRFETIVGNTKSNFRKSSICVFEDSKRQMWIGTIEGLFRYNPKSGQLRHFRHSDQDGSGLAGNDVYTIAEDKMGNIWVGTDEGLNVLKNEHEGFINYRKSLPDNPVTGKKEIHSLTIADDTLWIASEEGLILFDLKTGIASRYQRNERDNHSLTAKSIRYVHLDKQGICWLGTSGGGVNKYDKNLNLFDFVQSNVFDSKGLNASVVTSFAEKEDGKIFIGTEGGGLSLFDCKTKLFQRIPLLSKLKSPTNYVNIHTLQKYGKNQLLIGTASNGLFVLDIPSSKCRQLTKGEGGIDLNSNDIYCLKVDRKGNIWVGTNGGGVNILNSEFKVVTRFTPAPSQKNDIELPINGYIRDIIEDREGNFWIATHGGGLARYESTSRRFTIYNTFNSRLPNDKVQSLLEDNQGHILAATFGGGIGLFDKNTRQFSVFSEKDGLQNSTVYKILEDCDGMIWASTNKGISRIDIATKKISNFNHHNGVQQNNFVCGSGRLSSDGVVFFGGLEGFNYFNPSFLKKNDNIPSVLITDLRISNQSVPASENGPIQEHISLAKEINLDYKQNFAFRFVGLTYTAPEQNQFAYKLEGFDKDWNYVGRTNTASYTNLDPGEYIFHVRASNNDGVWNNEGTSIKVQVHPPIWRTNYAYGVYILLIAGLIFYSRHKSLEKMRRKFALEQERLHAEQERKEADRIHSLDLSKIKFLTNLSHEFRTPISLILGPVDHLLNDLNNIQLRNHAHMIKRNARRLLNLVNQLLDFRKMEEQELRLNTSQGDLVAFVKEVSDSFKDLSERKKVNFDITTNVDRFVTHFDHDKMERILFNLLSNAFKFTPEGGTVNLHLSKENNTVNLEQTFILKVSDTGIGIPVDKRERIFEHFFQHATPVTILNQGSGIGLSITNEFVKMHKGTIEVESEEGCGAVFTVKLPFVPMEIPIETAGESSIIIAENRDVTTLADQVQGSAVNGMSTGRAGLPTILLVEDNDDFRSYLKESLCINFNVVEAANGKEGWQKALSNHPKLIVSDISMPVMSGIELCLKIKADKRTCHIPVILLTALTGEEDQLKGLKTGAHDYITKPFNSEVLNTKIKNLLDLNTVLKNTYTKQIKAISPAVEHLSNDEMLLHSIILYLEENLNNPQLSVEELSKHVGMSRSSLYFKLLELTGQTPVEYIRSVKLDKAAALFEKTDMNIAQVAYSVGFSTPNYFAKAFKTKFKMLPSEYIAQARNSKEKNIQNS